MIQRLRNKHENRDEENAKTNPFDGTLNCFLFAWFIAGLMTMTLVMVSLMMTTAVMG